MKKGKDENGGFVIGRGERLRRGGAVTSKPCSCCQTSLLYFLAAPKMGQVRVDQYKD